MARGPKQKRMRAKAVEEQEEIAKKIENESQTGSASAVSMCPEAKGNDGVAGGSLVQRLIAAHEPSAEIQANGTEIEEERAEMKVKEEKESTRESDDGNQPQKEKEGTKVALAGRRSDVEAEDMVESEPDHRQREIEKAEESADDEEDEEDDDYDESGDESDDASDAGEAEAERDEVEDVPQESIGKDTEAGTIEAKVVAEDFSAEDDNVPSAPRDTLAHEETGEPEKDKSAEEVVNGMDIDTETEPELKRSSGDEEEVEVKLRVRNTKRKKKPRDARKRVKKQRSLSLSAPSVSSVEVTPKRESSLRKTDPSGVLESEPVVEVVVRKKIKDKLRNKQMQREGSVDLRKRKKYRKSLSAGGVQRTRAITQTAPYSKPEEVEEKKEEKEVETKVEDASGVQWARSAEAEAIMQMLKAEADRINDPQHGKTIEVESNVSELHAVEEPKKRKSSNSSSHPKQPVTVVLPSCLSGAINVNYAALSDREKILNEIIYTERAYVQDLNVMIHVYLKPLREASLVTLGDIQQLFSNIEVIFGINKEFNADLEVRVRESGGVDILVGDLLLKLAAYFKLYTMYCINQSLASQKFRDLCDESMEFRQLMLTLRQHEACRKMDLPTFLIKPMQRLCKYPLLIKELLRKTDDDHPDKANLEAAMEQVSGVVKYINERKRGGENQQKIVDIQHHIDGCPSILAASRKFIRDAVITIVENKVTHKRQLYLFNDMLLIAKVQRKGLLANSEETARSSFDRLVELKDLKIVDHADTDEVKNAFELCHKLDDTLFQLIVSCETGESKREWIKDIKSIVKEHQREEYLANKDRLVKEQEEREDRRRAVASLSRPEANPQPGENSDSWTLGLILWHLYTGRPLFEGLSFEQAAVALMTRSFVPSLDDPTVPLPADLTELLEDCWLEKADSRPSFSMAYDRVRMLDTNRPENPFAVGMAVEQAKQIAARARMAVVKPVTPKMTQKKK